MFERLQNLFTSRRKDTSDDNADQEQVALAVAMLLLEVAWVDHELETREVEHICTTLQSLYGVDTVDVDRVIDQAREEHEKSTGVFRFTRQLNELLSYDERRELLDYVWQINDFDSEFHYEEGMIRRIAELLYLNHSDFIASKLRAKEED